MVWPSGGALATTSMPMVPPAPARLSTISGCPHRSFSFWPSTRPIMSMLLPGPIWITMRTGRVGNAASCAIAALDVHSISGTHAYTIFVKHFFTRRPSVLFIKCRVVFERNALRLKAVDHGSLVRISHGDAAHNGVVARDVQLMPHDVRITCD